MDQLPSEVVSSLFLEASKQRIGDLEFSGMQCFCQVLPGCIGRSCLGVGQISVLPSRTGRYSLQVEASLRDATRGVLPTAVVGLQTTTWITGCLERPVGPFA